MEDFTFNNWLVAGLLALASVGSFLISEPWLGVLAGGCSLAVVLAQAVKRRGYNMKYTVYMLRTEKREFDVEIEASSPAEAKQLAEATPNEDLDFVGELKEIVGLKAWACQEGDGDIIPY